MTKSNQSFSILNRIKSFKYAFAGLKTLLKEEHNSRIHLLATVCVISAGFFFKTSPDEWIYIIIAIGFVVVSEIFNSAIENIADFISPKKDERIKKIKDLSAAAVLISAITALIIGLIIFLPKFKTIL